MTRRQARADLAWLAAGFAALQVGLAVAADWLPAVRDPVYADKVARLRARLADPGRPFTVVMLGSSRTAYGLRGAVLEERLSHALGRPAVAFNFGQFAAGPVGARLTLERLLADGIRPDVVLAEVPPAFLAGQPGGGGELDKVAATRLRRDELPLVAQYGVPGEGLARDWWQARLMPWYAFRFNLVSGVAPQLLPVHLRQNWGRVTDAAGWGAHTAHRWTPANRQAVTAAARHSLTAGLAGFQLGGPSCQALHDLLGRCRAEGLPAALVFMPESAEYRGWYPPDAWAAIEAFVDGLGRDYGATVINARAWVADDHFSDGHHLFAAGAVAFTARLGPHVTRLLAPNGVARGE
jgi:hypothetical protein